jgi:hypothetical protein
MMFLDVLVSLVHWSPSALLLLQDNVLTGFADLFGGVVLLVIGVLVIMLIVAAAIVLLPAIVLAFLVWLVTGSFFYAGIVFLLVAVISIVAYAGD